MKKLAVLATLLALAGLIVAPAVAAGPTSKAGKSNTAHLYLYEKNPADWSIVAGGAWGKMKYNLSGPTFDYVFNGHGLVPGGSYKLIYYPDKTGNPWPRIDIICLGSGVANSDGNVNIHRSVETNTDLPNTATDINSGAKIWLVESAAVNCATNTMSGWNPTAYLFEYDLITFDDTDL